MNSPIALRITEEMKNAMKAHEALRVEVLRMLTAAIRNREIEKRTRGESDALTDEEVMAVLSREAKKRKEAADVYTTGNRPELAAKERDEVKIIEEFLPAQMSEDEVLPYVLRAIEATGATTNKDMGKVMAAVMKELKGKADSSLIGKIAKQKLEK